MLKRRFAFLNSTSALPMAWEKLEGERVKRHRCLATSQLCTAIIAQRCVVHFVSCGPLLSDWRRVGAWALACEGSASGPAPGSVQHLKEVQHCGEVVFSFCDGMSFPISISQAFIRILTIQQNQSSQFQFYFQENVLTDSK